MAKAIDYNKHIWEGWTVQDFVDELEPIFNMIIRKQSFIKPFKTEQELKEWCMNEQPYIKKHIPEVFNHFKQKLNL